MQQLTANDLFRAWESGSRRHPVDRAILLLFLACPDQSFDELWQLTIGDRNRILLSLYEQTAGGRMDCIATCGHCGEKNEFTVSVDDIRYPAPTAREGQWQGTTCSVRFRQPNNLDLAAVAEIADIKTAGLTLARRCIVAAGVEIGTGHRQRQVYGDHGQEGDARKPCSRCSNRCVPLARSCGRKTRRCRFRAKRSPPTWRMSSDTARSKMRMRARRLVWGFMVRDEVCISLSMANRFRRTAFLAATFVTGPTRIKFLCGARGIQNPL